MRKKSSKNIGPMLPGFEISEIAECTTLRPLTSFVADSPVKTSLQPVDESALQERDRDCGKNSTVSFANYDHAMSLWRTLQLSLYGELIPYSETWPRAGMMLSGKCYQQPNLEHHTYENESSLLPTPTVTDAESGRINKSGPNAKERPTLALMARKNLWPTPAARDYRHSGSKAGYHRRRAKGHQQSLNEEVVHGPNGHSCGQLNPAWVEKLMGFPEGWTEI